MQMFSPSLFGKAGSQPLCKNAKNVTLLLSGKVKSDFLFAIGTDARKWALFIDPAREELKFTGHFHLHFTTNFT